MRIGFFSPYYFPNIIGGSEVSAKLLVRGLIEKGHDIVVISFDKTKGSFKDNSKETIVRYRSFDPKEPLNLIPFTFKAMKNWENSVDLFHLYDVTPMPGAGIYKLLRGKKKVVATLNNYQGFCPANLYWGECSTCILTKRLKCLDLKFHTKKGKLVQFPYSIIFSIITESSKFIDKYIALSEVVKRSYVSFGFDDNKIEVIPNFFDPSFINNKSVNLETNKNKTKNTFNILYVGRMSEEKGVDLLIKAFIYLSNKYENIRLILVGDGPKLFDLVKLANRNEKIVFTGKLTYEEVQKYYSIADVFVHPSIWPEPFGRTILEALYFRVPLIVSNIGAPHEIAKSSTLIFKNGDVSSLIKNIDTLINDEKLRNHLKSNCSDILKNYNQEKILNKIIGLYERMLRY